MGDPGRGRFEARGEARPSPSPLGELVETQVRRLITSIVIAGGLIAAAIYMGEDSGPNYQVTAADGRIIRVNTESGTVIACEGKTCAIVLQRGQRLDDELPARALPAPAAAPVGALPAPAAAPAPAPAAGSEAVPAAEGR